MRDTAKNEKPTDKDGDGDSRNRRPMMARMPATIIRTLIKIDHAQSFLYHGGNRVAVALMTVPPKFHQESFET